MERKINLHLFYMGVVTAIVGILITTVIYYHFFRSETRQTLAHECQLVAESYRDISSPDKLSAEIIQSSPQAGQSFASWSTTLWTMP